MTSLLFLTFLLCFVQNFASAANQLSPPPFACDASTPTVKNFGFCNKSLTIDVRVQDLLKWLTLEEKLSFLVSNAGNVSRLGIPRYQWWSEALHGVSYVGGGSHFSDVIPGATSFPQVILTAASFNASLFEAIGKVKFISILCSPLLLASLRIPMRNHHDGSSLFPFGMDWSTPPRKRKGFRFFFI